jgi:hypothetical protein
MEMESPFMALGLLQEAKARARYHDDWEQDFEALEARTRKEETRRAVRVALLKIAALFSVHANGRRPAHA